MWLIGEESEGSNFMLINFGTELRFKADLGKQTHAGKDHSFRSVWNLHLATHSDDLQLKLWLCDFWPLFPSALKEKPTNIGPVFTYIRTIQNS